MTVQLASEGPRFVAPYRPEKGGVDFLGLRQVNLAMMALCLPGINNVTRYIRPFSLVSWIYWKFYSLSEPSVGKVNEAELREWKEKVEILFTWGHKLNGIGGIPGIDAKPPRTGNVPLDFAAWKRSAQNTSLMAAVTYGPAAKTIDGLGFLEPVVNKFFQTVGPGVALAEALDSRLRRFRLLKDLGLAQATAKQADAIFPAWSILEPSKAEQRNFRLAFFDRSTVGDATRIGRRSTTIQLALDVLKHSRRPLSPDEVRISMFRGRLSAKRPKVQDPKLRPTWLRWVVLQIRQSQRLAFEGLLSWFEALLVQGYHDTEEIVERTLKAIAAHDSIFPSRKPGQAMKPIQRHVSNLDDALDDERNFDPFWLMDQALEALRNHSETLAPYCLRILLVCAAFTQLLHGHAAARVEVFRGGSDRVSLGYWTDTLRHCNDFELRDFLRFLFERLILSQHFAVAARRFDGHSQRLRISIEEDGLEFLADRPFVPSISLDRLDSALSLMWDCGLISWDNSEVGYYAK